MPRIAEIEFTPNPNARKFILRDPLTYGVSRSYESAEQAKGDELAEALFAVPHVTNVFYVDTWITVTQDGRAHWPDLLRQLAVPIRDAPTAQERSAELINQGQALFQSGASDSLLALRSLSLDAERAKTIRNVDGSVAFEITEDSLVRTLLLSPGSAIAGGTPPACTVRIGARDFWALSRGEKHPFELLMDGKIRLQGRMEVAMALSSVLVG